MPDYATMYRKLFNSQTDAIEILQRAQRETEEMYISSPNPELKVFPQPESEPDDEE